MRWELIFTKCTLEGLLPQKCTQYSKNKTNWVRVKNVNAILSGKLSHIVYKPFAINLI